MNYIKEDAPVLFTQMSMWIVCLTLFVILSSKAHSPDGDELGFTIKRVHHV